MGKTIQAISILAYLRETIQLKNMPHLIVGPKSTISNWIREFEKWAPFFRVVNLVPTCDVRDEIFRK